jgi:hypothetical protein
MRPHRSGRPPRLKTVLLAFSLLLVVACKEDEKACHDRIHADLLQESELARKSFNLDYADTAVDSAYTALAIYLDEDRSICDYVTAGPRLERK